MRARRIDGASSFRVPEGGTLVMIGIFDGVHRGHRAILEAGAVEARRRGLAPLVFTFHPHPAGVLGRSPLALLTAIEHRAELICQIDPALRVVVEPFTPELAAMPPSEFAGRLLASELGARVVLVGQNFRFGAGRSGDFSLLQTLGQDLGFEARALKLVGNDAGVISSSRAREAMAKGELASVEQMLGRPHALSGTVVQGDGRGRTMGVPTANLDDVQEVLPPNGVYACLVDQLSQPEGGVARAAGVANLGVRPTVGTARSTVEVHLLDFVGELYGQRLRLHLLARLRAEQTFAGFEELKIQIERDIAQAREVIRSRELAADQRRA